MRRSDGVFGGWVFFFFLLLKERVNGKTARAASLEDASVAWTRWSLPTQPPSLSLLSSAAVARRGHGVGSLECVFYRQISQHKWLHLGFDRKLMGVGGGGGKPALLLNTKIP